MQQQTRGNAPAASGKPGDQRSGQIKDIGIAKANAGGSETPAGTRSRRHLVIQVEEDGKSVWIAVE